MKMKTTRKKKKKTKNLRRKRGGMQKIKEVRRRVLRLMIPTRTATTKIIRVHRRTHLPREFFRRLNEKEEIVNSTIIAIITITRLLSWYILTIMYLPHRK